MANINKYLEDILIAIYGEEVRGSIHDAIEEINKQADEAYRESILAKDSAKNSAKAASDSAMAAKNSELKAKEYADNLSGRIDQIDDIDDRLNVLADSDDETLDQLSEIVSYIKSNRTLIESITTTKVSVSDVIDSLTSTSKTKPLSANQGRILKSLIDNIQVNAIELTASLTANDDTKAASSVATYQLAHGMARDNSKLDLSGGALSGKLDFPLSSGGNWVSGRNNACIRINKDAETVSGTWYPAISIKGLNNSWEIGVLANPAGYESFAISKVKDSDFDSGSNAHTYFGFKDDGSVSFGNTVTAPIFNGSLNNLKITRTENIGQSYSANSAIAYINDYSGPAHTSGRKDGALYMQQYNSNYVHQIFGDYISGGISVRGKVNGTFGSWYRVVDDNNWANILPCFMGAATDHAGVKGLVPAPAKKANANDYKLLRDDGNWCPLYHSYSDNSYIHPASTAGLTNLRNDIFAHFQVLENVLNNPNYAKITGTTGTNQATINSAFNYDYYVVIDFFYYAIKSSGGAWYVPEITKNKGDHSKEISFTIKHNSGTSNSNTNLTVVLYRYR